MITAKKILEKYKMYSPQSSTEGMQINWEINNSYMWNHVKYVHDRLVSNAGLDIFTMNTRLNDVVQATDYVWWKSVCDTITH